MASHPISSFPLLLSDQADVIRIFYELMQERDRADRASEDSTNKPLDATSESAWFPGDLPGLD